WPTTPPSSTRGAVPSSSSPGPPTVTRTTSEISRPTKRDHRIPPKVVRRRWKIPQETAVGSGFPAHDRRPTVIFGVATFSGRRDHTRIITLEYVRADPKRRDPEPGV